MKPLTPRELLDLCRLFASHYSNLYQKKEETEHELQMLKIEHEKLKIENEKLKESYSDLSWMMEGLRK